MKIIRANKYFYVKGGAENSFFSTAELIKEKGHQDIPFSMKHERNLSSKYSSYFVSNVDYESKNLGHLTNSAFKLFYSFEARRNFERLVRDTQPDVIHLHNIYHQISPSINHVIKKYNLPAVMTLHDYKVVCGSYSMFANERPCEACKGGRHYQCILKKCVKDSYLKSLITTFEMYLHHQLLHVYDLVDIFIAPSRFLKDKAEEMGFKGKIVHLYNFIHVNEFEPYFGFKERTICYIGRLSKEKGVSTLIDAMKGLDIKLKIIGEGPLKEDIGDRLKNEGIKNVELLGYMSGQKLKEEVQSCMFTVIPSEWYENNPRSVIESFALGKPVIGARIGGIPELVRDNETGLTFEPGNANDLHDKISQFLSKPDEIERMGRNSRRIVEEEFNPNKHYEALLKIYQSAIEKYK